MQNETSRRALIVGAGVAAIALATPALASTSASNHLAWADALAHYHATSAAFSQASDALDHAQGSFFEQQPARPSFVMEVEGDYGRFGRHVLPVTISDAELDDPSRTWADPERVAQMRAELASYRTATATLTDRLNLDALEEDLTVTLAQQSDALRRLVAIPAPDLKTLVEKLAIVLGEFDDEGGAIAAVLADVRRLSKREG